MKYKIIIIISILTLTISSESYTQEEGRVNQDTSRINSSIAFSGNLILAGESTAFFKEYNSGLGGLKTGFDISASAGAALKFELAKIFRLGLNVSYFESKLLENYTQTVVIDQPVGSRKISQNLFIRSIPTLLTLEYVPYNQQFKSYFGIGAGALISNIHWKEDITSSISYDTRRSGIIIDEKNIYPSFRIYSGTELLFDRKRAKTFSSGLVIEVSYTYTSRKAKIFENIAQQLANPPDTYHKNISVIPGFVSLGLALSFEFTTVTRY